MAESKFKLFKTKSAGASESIAPIAGKKNVKKNWMLVLGVVVGGAVMVNALLSDPAPPPVTKKDNGSLVSTTPKGAEEKAWQATSQKEMADLKQSQGDLLRAVSTLKDELAKERETRSAAISQAVKDATVNSALPEGLTPPPSMPGQSAPPSQGLSIKPPSLPSLSGKSRADLPAIEPTAPGAGPGSFGDSPEGRGVFTPPPPAKKAAAPEPAAQTAAEAAKLKSSLKKNKYAGFLPAGSFFRVALLHGVDAGTSTAAASNPQPLLMSVQDDAILPGEAKYRIKGCFVLSSAHGDLSAERIYARTAQLSCVDKSHRTILTAPLQGYVIDSDNKVGLRGVISDRQGAKLAKATLAGWAQGLAGVFGQAQGITESSAFGTTTSISGGAAIRASGLSGAQTAAQQLAQFYLKEAQSIFPVITVDGGRNATVTLTEGVSLEWSSADDAFAKEVKPNNTSSQ